MSSLLEQAIIDAKMIKEAAKKNAEAAILEHYTEEIKQKIIEFITIPEFSKAFGVKKSAEVISAITRDTWNQSTALFISFLLDSSIIYKDKPYLFNKEKNRNEILVN